MIDYFKQTPMLEEFNTTSKQVILNNRPKGFKEARSKAIRAQCFVGIHTKKSESDLFWVRECN